MNDAVLEEILETGKEFGKALEALELLVESLVEKDLPPLSEFQRGLYAEALEKVAAARKAYGRTLRNAGFPAPFFTPE